MTQPTRKERQAHTRARLMRSAASVAAERGLERASLAAVAEHAGFTKGAVYANFESKEDLFLAMLDARFAERLAELDRILSTEDDPDTQAREAAAGFMAAIACRARVGAAVLRVRGARGAPRGLPRWSWWRATAACAGRIAELLERRAERLGIEPAIPAEQVATMTFAMANGIALERMLEPDAVPRTRWRRR